MDLERDVHEREAHARSVAMAYAMQTAVPGEPGSDILARAMIYAHWVTEPLKAKAGSDKLGEPATPRLQ